MNKNNRKEYLYSIAFKLFLTRGFDAVSITDIEKASGMTRGAISYYGKDKRGLYYNVVKHFLVDKQNLGKKMENSEFSSLQEFIDKYIKASQATIDSIHDIDRTVAVNNGSRVYMALILQVCEDFPDLNEIYLTNRNNELLKWIEVLNHAVKNNEIRDDIDIWLTAKNFMTIFYGKSFLDALSVGLNTVELRMQFQNLYNLIKK